MEIFRIRKAYKENGILGLVDTKGLYRKNKTKLSAWMQEYALREYRTFGAGGFNFTSIVDIFSGVGVATLASKSNSLSLTRLLWKAIDKFGKPDMIKGDNGKDHLSKDFQSLLDGLNITYDVAIAYAGEQKALVERRFGTLQHAGISKMHGYIGNNLTKREMIEQKNS